MTGRPGVTVTVERTTAASRAGAVVGALVLVALIALPWTSDAGVMRVIVEFIALLVLAQMWNLLAGYAGLVSIGQQAYVGVGGYALMVLADDVGVNPFLAVPLAGLVAAVFALPTAALVFRFTGGYFAVGTWAVAEVYRLLIANADALGRGTGRTLKAVFPLARETRELATYGLAVALGVTALVAIYVYLRSRRGLGLMAVAMGKAVILDLQGVPQIWRIASFIGLGLLMLGVAVAYSKVSAIWDDKEEAMRPLPGP